MHDMARPLETLSDANAIPICAVCGGGVYRHNNVIWPELANAWKLSWLELAYINRQQGTQCVQCLANIRSIALARAISLSCGHEGTLDELIRMQPTHALLEINEAGTLHARLSRLPGHRFGAYPEIDLTQMSFPEQTFDLVVHSDTLEHVPDPMQALRETRRVLKEGGVLVFTVPLLVARMSSSCAGKPPSYHGNPAVTASDFIVHTEFGADAWAMVLQAGFTRCEMVAFDYPAGIAMIAR